jgi:hypothetical protein
MMKALKLGKLGIEANTLRERIRYTEYLIHEARSLTEQNNLRTSLQLSREHLASVLAEYAQVEASWPDS